MFVLFTSTVEQGVDMGGGWVMGCPVHQPGCSWHRENQGWSYRGDECHGPFPLAQGKGDGIYLDYRT